MDVQLGAAASIKLLELSGLPQTVGHTPLLNMLQTSYHAYARQACVSHVSLTSLTGITRSPHTEHICVTRLCTSSNTDQDNGLEDFDAAVWWVKSMVRGVIVHCVL